MRKSSSTKVVTDFVTISNPFSEILSRRRIDRYKYLQIAFKKNIENVKISTFGVQMDIKKRNQRSRRPRDEPLNSIETWTKDVLTRLAEHAASVVGGRPRQRRAFLGDKKNLVIFFLFFVFTRHFAGGPRDYSYYCSTFCYYYYHYRYCCFRFSRLVRFFNSLSPYDSPGTRVLCKWTYTVYSNNNDSKIIITIQSYAAGVPTEDRALFLFFFYLIRIRISFSGRASYASR